MKDLLPRSFVSLVRSLAISLALLVVPASALADSLTMNVGPSLGSIPVGQFEYGLVATGGTGPYTWQIVAGALPDGLALRGDQLPSWFPPGSSAGIVGVVTVPGTYPFTIRVTSGVEFLDVETTMTVTALTARDNELPPAIKGLGYSYQLELLNAAPGGTTSWSTDPGSLPAGLTLSNTGLLSGTPTVTGGFNINYTVTDGTDMIGRSAHLEIQGLAITTTELPVATQNAAYSATLTAAGGTGPYTFSLNGSWLPNGLSLEPGTGVISGTATWGAGRFGFGVSVTDSLGATAWKNMTLLITAPPPHAPLIAPYGGQFQDCTVGSGCSLGINVETGNGPFTWSASGQPQGMFVTTSGEGHISWLNMGDGGLWGVPTAAGDYNIVVTITDVNGEQTTNIFPLHVSALALSMQWPNGTLGTALNAPLRVIGGTAPYAIVYLPEPGGYSRLPEGVTLVNGVLTGTPVENGLVQSSLPDHRPRREYPRPVLTAEHRLAAVCEHQQRREPVDAAAGIVLQPAVERVLHGDQRVHMGGLARAAAAGADALVQRPPERHAHHPGLLHVRHRGHGRPRSCEPGGHAVLDDGRRLGRCGQLDTAGGERRNRIQLRLHRHRRGRDGAVHLPAAERLGAAGRDHAVDGGSARGHAALHGLVPFRHPGHRRARAGELRQHLPVHLPERRDAAGVAVAGPDLRSVLVWLGGGAALRQRRQRHLRLVDHERHAADRHRRAQAAAADGAVVQPDAAG